MNSESEKILVVSGVVAGGILLFWLADKAEDTVGGLLEAMGLKDDQTNKDASNAADQTSAKLNTWDALVWKPSAFTERIRREYPSNTYGWQMNLSASQATELAKRIDSAQGLVYDSPQNALAAFKLCKNKIDVSRVAAAYLDRYRQDANLMMQNVFDTDAQQKIYVEIINYISSLPLGIYRRSDTTKKILF